MWFNLGTFYVSMALAGLLVELAFKALGLIPTGRHVAVANMGITFNYTTVLDIVFLALAALLVYRFMRTGGPKMLHMMDMPPTAMDHTAHA